MHNDWLVVANASCARIFSIRTGIGIPKKLNLVKEIHHFQSRMKRQDLLTDRPGVYKSGPAGTGGHSQDSILRDIEMEQFAKQLANIIDHARTLNQFDRLIITASPHFCGLLNTYLTGSIKDLIKKVVPKDYTGVVERDLERLFFSKPARIPCTNARLL